MKQLAIVFLLFAALAVKAQQPADVKMKVFIDALMKKMTLEEKIRRTGR
jgi:hypothetical protein